MVILMAIEQNVQATSGYILFSIYNNEIPQFLHLNIT